MTKTKINSNQIIFFEEEMSINDMITELNRLKDIGVTHIEHSIGWDNINDEHKVYFTGWVIKE